MACKRFIVSLVGWACFLLPNCIGIKNEEKASSDLRDSIVYIYNDYLDNPQDPYVGGWSKPTVELGLIAQSYWDYKADNAFEHYILTNLGDTIPATLFQRVKMNIRGYDSIFKTTIQSNKYKNKYLVGVNLVNENDRITYYMLWPTDSTRAFYGQAKLVKWKYHFGERVYRMEIVDGVFISS